MQTQQSELPFSLITPAYNNPEEVGRLLESVRPDVLKDRTLEVIVVDDCSKDDSIKKVVSQNSFAKYIRLETNSGPAEARNAGARSAKNDILIFVDSDVILNHDTISRIKDKFNNDGAVAIFGGEYDIEAANPSLSTKFKALMVRSWCPSEDYVTVFLTRLGAIKKSIFDEVGGFDSTLKTAAVEDYELGRRLANKGYTIHYDPSVTVKHHFPGFKKQIRLFFHRSFMWTYIFEKYGRFDNTCTTPLVGMAQVCGFLVSLFLAASIINVSLLYAASFFLLLFILTNLKFFKLTFKHEGLLFTFKSIPMALVISCSVVLGGAWGIIHHFIYAKDK